MPRHDISSRFHGLSTLFTSSANQIKALPAHFGQRFSPASPCQASPKHCNTSPLHSQSALRIAIAIQYPAFPRPRVTVHFHSVLFVAFFGLPLLIVTPLCTSELFVALPLLSVSIQCLCVVIRFHAHAKLRFSTAPPYPSPPCRCYAILISAATVLRISCHCHRGACRFCSLPLLFMVAPLLRFSMPSPSLAMLFCSAAHPYPTQPMLHAAQLVQNITIHCLSTA